jgi:hypothetical protein
MDSVEDVTEQWEKRLHYMDTTTSILCRIGLWMYLIGLFISYFGIATGSIGKQEHDHLSIGFPMLLGLLVYLVIGGVFCGWLITNFGDTTGMVIFVPFLLVITLSGFITYAKFDDLLKEHFALTIFEN